MAEIGADTVRRVRSARRHRACRSTGAAIGGKILADLDRFLTEDDLMRRALHTRPIAAELGFGFAGEIDAVPLTLDDGRALRFRGKADRVDRADDGSLLVLDYKTGKSDNYRGLSDDDPDQAGSLLQLPVYGQAARLHQQRARCGRARRVLVRVRPRELRDRGLRDHARGADPLRCRARFDRLGNRIRCVPVASDRGEHGDLGRVRTRATPTASASSSSATPGSASDSTPRSFPTRSSPSPSTTKQTHR